VAKAVNCQKVKEKDFEPCGECSTCISIANGSNLDVLEIDGASNTGIDDIRQLREKIRLAPSQAKYKVYIIDEVHMLSNAAFNGLLKTLEEPPAHALFILCTTALEKLPDTIISRCTRINFKKASQEEIVEKLKLICKQEGFQFKEEDLVKIAQAAGGSFRDANKILEQAATSSVDEVIETLGEFDPQAFLAFLKNKKTKEAVVWVNKAMEQGANLRIMTEEVLRLLREALLVKYGIEVEGNKEEVNCLTSEEIKQLIELFSRAAMELKGAVIPQLPLEMAVIEWGEAKTAPAEKKATDEDKGQESKPVEEKKTEVEDKDKETKTEKKLKTEPVVVVQAGTPLDLTNLITKWPEVLEKVRPLNHSVQAFLKACRPLGLEGGFLTLEVFYKFHKDQLESEKCRRIVEKVCSEVYCLPVKVKFILGQRSVKSQAVAEVTGTAAVEVRSQIVKTETAGEIEEDIIKIAQDIFGGGQVQ